MRTVELSEEQLDTINTILNMTDDVKGIECIFLISYYVEEDDADHIDMMIAYNDDYKGEIDDLVKGANAVSKRLSVKMNKSSDYNIEIDELEQFMLISALSSGSILFDRNSYFLSRKALSLQLAPKFNNINKINNLPSVTNGVNNNIGHQK